MDALITRQDNMKRVFEAVGLVLLEVLGMRHDVVCNNGVQERGGTQR